MTKKYRLISFDLDGTLLNSKMVLSRTTRSGLHQIIRSGINCIIISSRTLKSILTSVKGLGITYVSCLSGSLIYNVSSSKIEYLQNLKAELVKEIVSYFVKKEIIFHLFTKENVFISSFSQDPSVKRYQKSLKPKLLKKFSYEKDIISIEMTLNDEAQAKKTKKDLKKSFGDHLNITNAGYNFLEISKKGIDKGKSLEYIADKLNIPLSQTMAIGDSESDLTMLKKAGLGICMKNSEKVLLNSIKKRTLKDNNENGAIEEVLKELNIKG